VEAEFRSTDDRDLVRRGVAVLGRRQSASTTRDHVDKNRSLMTTMIDWALDE